MAKEVKLRRFSELLVNTFIILHNTINCNDKDKTYQTLTEHLMH